MSIKIRCTKCRRKLWVDEAFAGGVCRCPHCRELFLVPAKGRLRLASGRPDSPPAQAGSSHRAEPVPGAVAEGLPAARLVRSHKATIAAVVALAAAAVIGAIVLARGL